MTTLKEDHPALKGRGRTIFPVKVIRAEDAKRLLQPASTNKKLGDGGQKITKGKWKGMPMYSLSLEERKTCPKTCDQWRNCYGNGMPFANRIDHTSPKFFKSLETELGTLAKKHMGGFVVRLHVLGDFYSVRYVNFWVKALKTHENLRIFGYTHRTAESTIGSSIQKLNMAGAWIRWSDASGPMSANSPPLPTDIVCPQQTRKTASCMTCGLCWSTPKSIGFLTH